MSQQHSMHQHAKDEHYMRRAIELAHEAASMGEVPIGAVVVCDDEIIAEAFNRRETNHDPTAHAEFSALHEASQKLGRWRLSGCTVYVTLEPCAMCAGLMVNARIDRCVFGTSDAKSGALGSVLDLSAHKSLNHSFEVEAGVLQSECADLLSSFFQALRNRNKA